MLSSNCTFSGEDVVHILLAPHDVLELLGVHLLHRSASEEGIRDLFLAFLQSGGCIDHLAGLILDVHITLVLNDGGLHRGDLRIFVGHVLTHSEVSLD